MPNGKICYLEIPATDIDVSSSFYQAVFGWEIRTRSDGQRAFDDTTGAVSGAWVLGRTPASAPGMVTYVMVDSIEATVAKIVAAGGTKVTPFTAHGPGGDGHATFTDPAGNLVGLYQDRHH